MRTAKEFGWEMGHRLPFHEGNCRNLHGHSYKMRVEFEGEQDENGMVTDFYDMYKMIQPLVDELDHSVIVCETDKELIGVLEKLNSRKFVVPFETTAENITGYFLEKMKEKTAPQKISKVKVRVYETEGTYAEGEIQLK